MKMYSYLADAMVVAHSLYVGFVVLGLLAILIGAALRWSWVRNLWFRTIHFAMIAVVAIEAMLGIVCPLTTWENNLRRLAGETVQEGSFMGRLAHGILFYEVPHFYFQIGHCVFGALVLLAFVLMPPRWRAHQLPASKPI